jgi:putative transcriptional regulator
MGRDTVPGFAAKVKQLRAAAGLTLMELADRAGTHFSTVSKVESEDRAPSLRLAVALADALGVTVNDLVPGHGKAKGGHKARGR